MTHPNTFTLTLQASELAQALQVLSHQSRATPWLIFDVSYDLSDAAWGRAQFERLHVVGARYVDLHADLSAVGDVMAINGGRHPLPTRDHFARWMAAQGITPDTQVVVYDRNGMNFCARLWWMLQWCGHHKVAVLDGGLKAWQDAGGQTTSISSDNRLRDLPSDRGTFPLEPYALGAPLVTLRDQRYVLDHLGQGDQTLMDARGKPRYLGLQEPLDPIAGHIPGALNRPFTENFDDLGFFKPKAQLKAEFEALLAGQGPQTVVHHCGSGVSAVPNILAMELAGLGRTALYAGSWSEWSRTPGLPVQIPNPKETGVGGAKSSS